MSILKGAFLTIFMRWTDRLFGLVSTLILARLLVPDDFGVVAMASLVVGLTEVLLDLGVHVALIRNRNVTLAHYHTAWTIRLMQVVVVALVILLSAPAAAVYFHEPRLTLVLQVLIISVLLGGLENIGIVTFQKEMKFELDVRFMFAKRAAGFLVTILLAYLWRNYWALVVGALTGRFVGVIVSYWMHPMRPRWSFEKLREIFSVSQWMLVNSVGVYLNSNLHKMLVGRRAPVATMGGYTLADEISGMPSSEVLAPINRVLFPAFASVQHDEIELKRLFLLALGMQTMLAIPASTGLIVVAHEAVAVLLGGAWLFVAPFVQVLAPAYMIQALTVSGSYVLLTMGHMRDVAMLTWASIIVFALGAFVVWPHASAMEIAEIRVLSVAACLVLSFWLLRRGLPIVGSYDIARTIIRPLIAAGVMAGAVVFVDSLQVMAPLGVLILKILVGLVVYPAAVLMMWWLCGRPAGAESYVLEKVEVVWSRARGRWSSQSGEEA